ncbi:unnamed protein product [Candidula unifasciata]|uniref:Uncharacterized protein n=1 Tax=Candidula unifasciata TaxID=100452 RepID=A0A8S3ZR48_9EUPU|nr:unnamed protein product [Candidula unifasciata]
MRIQDKEFLDDMAVASNGHSLQLNTQVGGLLMFEIPEVPTLNNNIQKFVQGNITCNAEAISKECATKNMTQQDKDINQECKQQHHRIYFVNGVKNYENITQQRKSPAKTASSLTAAFSVWDNHKSVIDSSTQHRKAVYDIWHKSENSNKEFSNFHQALLNAKNINQSYINNVKVTDMATKI